MCLKILRHFWHWNEVKLFKFYSYFFLLIQRLAKKISLLVFLNIICWGPVVYLCSYSLATNMGVINRTYLKVIAIIIMPFNSCLNPFMYCLSEKRFLQFIKRKLFARKQNSAAWMDRFPFRFLIYNKQSLKRNKIIVFKPFFFLTFNSCFMNF